MDDRGRGASVGAVARVAQEPAASSASMTSAHPRARFSRAPHLRARRTGLAGLAPVLATGLAGGGLAVVLGDAPYAAAPLTFLVFMAAALPVIDRQRCAAIGFSVRSVLLPVLFAAGLVLLLQAMTGIPGLGTLELAGVGAAMGLMALVADGRRQGAGRTPGIRVAVIGSQRAAHRLSEELAIAGVSGYDVVGWIDGGSGGDAETSSEVLLEPLAHLDAAPERLHIGPLGPLDELGAIVEGHGIDLLVMTGELPRLRVFDRVAGSCLDLPVRLCELASFYEDVFGRVPLTEINAAWFQYMLHPHYSAYRSALKRALDVSASSVLLLLSAPVLLLVALAIRRDGGPALYRQVRIGERGRPLTIYKLRTMRLEPGSPEQWSHSDDPRVTRLGRLLRRTHVDELPQLVNVLKGEMTLVGPRPEQPAIVERLEAIVPFYHRRHLIKPGLTGWAQVRCGYAGSDVGSALKVSYDLYYLKHRSLRLDLGILLDTVGFLFVEAAIERRVTSFTVPTDCRDGGVPAYRPPTPEAAGETVG